MDQLINLIRQTRANFSNLLEECTVDQLNEVPSGFGNNIIWNFAHIIASHQIICYQFANVAPIVDESFIASWRAGSRPEGYVDFNKVEQIKKLMLSSVEDFENELKKGNFQDYSPYTTRYGVHISNIAEATQYISVHDAIHFGYAKAIKKIIDNNKK